MKIWECMYGDLSLRRSFFIFYLLSLYYSTYNVSLTMQNTLLLKSNEHVSGMNNLLPHQAKLYKQALMYMHARSGEHVWRS